MERAVYIIPGLGESTKKSVYRKISGLFRDKDIEPIPVDISWKYRTMSDYVEQFRKRYQENFEREVYLFGFSFGAMICFISSIKIKPRMQFLCSLSPYFREDLRDLPSLSRKYFGKKIIKDLGGYSFNGIAKKVESEVVILVGSEEHKICLRRAREANKRLKNSKLKIIEGVEHDISQEKYLGSLEEIISCL